MTSMLDETWWGRMTAAELLEQVQIRRELQKSLIGDVYPLVLQDQIETLLALRSSLLFSSES